MSKRDGLKDPPVKNYPKTGAGLGPADGWKTPAGKEAEAAWGSEDWRTAKPGHEEM